MELLNSVPPDLSSAMHTYLAGNIVRLLAPLAPHAAEEWWDTALGRTVSIFRSGGWPQVDDRAIATALVTVVCQVNGKVRGHVVVAPDTDVETLKNLALAEPNVQKHLVGKAIRKTVVVPRRLINFVVG
jgi:leucyl-tRNA synthetase